MGWRHSGTPCRRCGKVFPDPGLLVLDAPLPVQLVIPTRLIDGLGARGMIFAPDPEGIVKHLIDQGGAEHRTGLRPLSGRRSLDQLLNRHHRVPRPWPLSPPRVNDMNLYHVSAASQGPVRESVPEKENAPPELREGIRRLWRRLLARLPRFRTRLRNLYLDPVGGRLRLAPSFGVFVLDLDQESLLEVRKCTLLVGQTKLALV